MLALIDGDIVAYRCAASAEDEHADIAFMRANIMLNDMMEEVQATGHKVFISGKREDNFRLRVNPEYKANRKDVVRPIHLDATKEFLVTQWGATTCQGYEADDGLGMDQRDSGTVICSIDKDLLQVPGLHYNFVKKLLTKVTPSEGLKNFYTQVLTGDRTDNVIGLAGIGPVKAGKILEGLLPEEYYEACRGAYNDDERLHSNCKLLWVWRAPNQIWEPPNEAQIKEALEEAPIQIRDQLQLPL